MGYKRSLTGGLTAPKAARQFMGYSRCCSLVMRVVDSEDSMIIASLHSGVVNRLLRNTAYYDIHPSNIYGVWEYGNHSVLRRYLRAALQAESRVSLRDGV